MNTRKKLSDILRGGNSESLSRTWETTQAAAELTPLPPGEYLCRCLNGELFSSKDKGTPGYKLTLEVTEGEYVGRRVWHDLWLTSAALPMSKRDLEKVGITRLEQLDQPLPAGILVRLWLGLRRDDKGTERNNVRRFEGAGVEPGDAFTPDASDEGEPLDTSFDVPEIEATIAGPASRPAAEPAPAPADTPTPAPDAPGRGRQRKPQQATLPLANGAAENGPYLEGR